MVSSDVLGKLVKEQKDRLYVRISLLSGKMPEILGLSCAAIFINGRNYITSGWQGNRPYAPRYP
ncbi:MAG: hypothetical protein ACPLSK_05680 [bacterium]